MARQSRDLVHFFMQGHAFLQVLELHRPANFGQDGESVRVPLDQDIAQADLLTVFHLHLGAVNHGIALFFAALVVQDGDGAVAIHHHQVAFLGAHGHQVDEAHAAVGFGIEARLLANARSRTADVEGTHGELGPRLADGLRRDDARGLAQLDQPAGSQVAPVTHHAHATFGLAGEHRTNLDALDTGCLHRARQVFGDLLVDVNDDVAFVVLDLLQRDAAHDTVTQRLDDLHRLHDGGDVDAIDRAAIVFADDHVLRHVHQAPGQVARIRRLESGIGQSLAGAVGGDEVLQHGQAFAEVRRDRGLDDFARRLGHQATHAGELTNLLLGTASAGVSHDVNGIDVADFVVLLHGGEHLVRNFFRDSRPDFDDFVVALAVGDGAVQILLLHRDRLLLGVAHQARFARRNDHVVDPNREARHGGEVETELLDAVQDPHRGFQTETQVAIVHQVAHALLLEQAVDVGHLRSAALQVVVHDGAAHGGRDELPLKVGGLGMDHVLIVIGDGEIDHLARVAQANRGQRFHFARFLRQDHFINVGECASLTFCARLGLGQVVNAQHHVLGGHGDRLSRRRRQDVVRGQHQHAGFHLRFRRQRNVHCHLIAVEIGVECGADQRVNLDGLAFHQHRLKSLNAEAVKRGRAIQQDGVVLNHFFQDVPYDGLLLLHHFLGLLDGGAVSGLLQPVIDERLEQFQRHLLGQAALVQLEVGTHHNDGAAGIVHALAQQVLAEAALLALQRVGQRLERTVVGATQHAATASIVEQRVHGLLQHALLIAHDDFRRMQVHQLLQAVVAVDDPAIQVVQVRSRKAAAIERNQGTQLRRDYRNHVQDHPLRLVTAPAECFNHLQALGILQTLLHRSLGAHFFAQFAGKTLHLNPLQQFLDGFGAHHGLEAAGAMRLVEFAVLGFILDDFALFDRRFAGLDHHVGLEVQHRFQLAQRNVKNVPDAAGQSLEEPHMRAGRCQLNVAEALAAHLGQGYLHAALIADHAAVLHALVFAAETLPVGYRPENAGAEQTIALRLEGAVVDGLRLGDFAVRPTADLFGRSQADADSVEVGDGISEIKGTGTVKNPPPPCGPRRGGLQGPAALARPLAAPAISCFPGCCLPRERRRQLPQSSLSERRA